MPWSISLTMKIKLAFLATILQNKNCLEKYHGTIQHHAHSYKMLTKKDVYNCIYAVFLYSFQPAQDSNIPCLFVGYVNRQYQHTAYGGCIGHTPSPPPPIHACMHAELKFHNSKSYENVTRTPIGSYSKLKFLN